MINHVRICKKMMLPCELVGFQGGKETKEMREWKTQSAAHWKVEFEIVRMPHKRLVEEWAKFVEQLTEQKVETAIDFDDKIETKCEISADRKYVKINNEIEELFQVSDCRYGKIIYEKVDSIEEQNLQRAIAEMK